MSSKNMRRTFGFFLLVFSLILMVWGFWPVASATRTLAVSSPSVKLPEPIAAVLPSVLAEDRQLILSWPAKVRVGDAASIRLVLQPALHESAGAPAAQSGSSDTNETLPASLLVDGGRIFIEARLELPGMQYTPTGVISEAFYPGIPVAFFWSTRAAQSGIYPGTVWVYLVFSPPEESREIRTVFSAQQFEIEAVSFLGFDRSAARVVGSLGVLVGAVLSLDGLFLQLWERIRK